MNTQVKKQILDILHKNIEVHEKQNILREASKKRRGNNKTLYLTIAKMLEESVMPLDTNKELRVFYLKNCSEEIFAHLREILKGSEYECFNAVCAEILWQHYHELEFAQLSIQNYQEMLMNCSGEDSLSYTRIVIRICYILSRCNRILFDISNFIAESLVYVNKHLDDSDFCTLFILNALIKCNKDMLPILQTYENVIEELRKKGNIVKAIRFAENLEKFYVDKKRKEELKEIRIKIAEMSEEAALMYDWTDGKYAHNIVQLIQQAINAWKRSGVENEVNERKRLAKQVEPVKALLLKSLQVIKTGPVDISDTIEQMESVIQTGSFEKIICNLAYMTKLHRKVDLIENSKNTFFADFFTTIGLDSRGRTRYILPPKSEGEKEEEKSIEHQASEQYIMFADAFVQRYLHIVKKHMNITKENLEFLVEDNAFIPEDRKESFLKGLVAGFELDLITAMSILMPQIENAIRCMVSECGVVVYKIYDDGVEECLSLDVILRLPEVEELFEEDFLFNLRVFFTSDYGFGMRNMVGHGLFSDRELQSSQCLAVWWFVLRLCCEYSGELRTRLVKQQDTQDSLIKTNCRETME